MFVIVAFGITLLAVSGMTGAVQMATIADVRLEQRIYAEDAAENAITEALARIRSGEVGLLSAITYEDEFNHSTGTVSFDTRGPYSTNNLESSSAISGWNGRLVPPRCIHLVAVGTSGGQKRVRELPSSTVGGSFWAQRRINIRIKPGFAPREVGRIAQKL